MHHSSICASYPYTGDSNMLLLCLHIHVYQDKLFDGTELTVFSKKRTKLPQLNCNSLSVLTQCSLAKMFLRTINTIAFIWLQKYTWILYFVLHCLAIICSLKLIGHTCKAVLFSQNLITHWYEMNTILFRVLHGITERLGLGLLLLNFLCNSIFSSLLQ